MVPDETTPWQLEYDDRFDRDHVVSIDKAGVGITAGLVALWETTLREGIDAQGKRTFSVFCLRWDEGYASIPIHFAEPSAALAKLRAWVFPATPSGAASPQTVNVALLRDLAQLHFSLVAHDGFDAFYEAAGRVLELCAGASTPQQLRP